MKAVNIALIGMPGCGKTAIGREAALLTGMQFIDTDAWIEERYGSIEALFAIGEAHFRSIESEAIAEAASLTGAVIATGGGSILREENMAVLQQIGKMAYVCRPLENILNDLNDKTRPLLKGKTHRLAELYKERKALYERYADFTLVNDGTFQAAVNELVAWIQEVAL